ncbi:MAG: hypothetical protein E5X56_24195, partial [Mesorhizobium sp.]|uniref:hypothetical protein n=1 Tax=Mesorhizobium sp. TaxID=1871066 RepID=UPI0011F535C5
DPQSVTIEEAVALIADKEAKGGNGGRKPFRKAAAAAKKPAAKKPAAQKVAAQKTAAKKVANKKG